MSDAAQKANTPEHQYDSNSFCKRCGWERQFIDKTKRTCLPGEQMGQKIIEKERTPIGGEHRVASGYTSEKNQNSQLIWHKVVSQLINPGSSLIFIGSYAGVEPELIESKKLRTEPAACTICGGTEGCRGWDTYAKVEFAFKRRVRAGMGGSYIAYRGFYRYVASTQIRFCTHCCGEDAMQVTRQREELRRQSGMKWRTPQILGWMLVGGGIITIISMCLADQDSAMVIVSALAAILIGIMLALIAGSMKGDLTPWSPQRVEKECIKAMTFRLLEQNKARFFAESGLSGKELNLEDHHLVARTYISPSNIQFHVEPEFRQERINIITGVDGVEWIGW